MIVQKSTKINYSALPDELKKRIKELKDENKRLKGKLKNYCDNCAHLEDWYRR